MIINLESRLKWFSHFCIPSMYQIIYRIIHQTKIKKHISYCPIQSIGWSVNTKNFHFSWLLTTTKLMGPTQDIQHIIGKLRMSAFLQCATKIWCGGSLRVSMVTKVGNSLPYGTNLFVQVLMSYLDFYKISVFNVSTFLMQKNYSLENSNLLTSANIWKNFFQEKQKKLYHFNFFFVVF